MKTKSDAPLRAYNVQGDEYGCVIFATSNVIARRTGADELGIEFSQIASCRRMPEADSFAEQGSVPTKELVETFGWWQECAYCASVVSAEVCAERIWVGESVFCNKQCQHKLRECEARAKKERESAAVKLEEAKALTIARFPGITNVRVFREWENDHRAYFDFPGGKRAASWLVGDDYLNVCECDAEQGKAFMESVKTHSQGNINA